MTGGLFERALGEVAFAALPAPVRRLHRGGAFAGEAWIEGAEGWMGASVARIAGLPRPGAAVPVRLVIAADVTGETWIRDFDTHRFASRLMPSAHPGCVVEKVGPLAVTSVVEASTEGTRQRVQGWHCLGIPLPGWLAPRAAAVEGVDTAGRYTFDVALTLPLGLGRITRYRGWLTPA